MFFNLYFEVDTIKSAHCVEHNLLFLMMPHDRYFIVKGLNGNPQKRSGWSILKHEKIAAKNCNINKISTHRPIDLKFAVYILETMDYVVAKTRVLALI